MDKNMLFSEYNNTAPFNQEAEQSILGAILISSACLEEIIEILPNPEYFYLPSHKLIYKTILGMFTLGTPVDYITVLNELRTTDFSEQNNFKSYLFQLAQSVPTLSNISSYANIVKENFYLRKLITTAQKIIEDANSGEFEIPELIELAEQRIFDIRKEKTTNGLQQINEILLQTFERLHTLNSEDAKNFKGLSTGISELDDVILGLNKSDLILLAARPGMGKTSFSLNIALNAAVKENKKIAFFSLEMNKEQLASRLISMQGSIPNNNLRTGKLSTSEWKNLMEVSEAFADAQLYIDDTPSITVPEIKSKLRRLKNLDLVIIDYLQLMSSAKRIDNRVQEISEITRNLKIMAKELDVPLITLSQLSRASEQRTDHRPLLSDLRDSGSIEQDADIVMFLYRENYYASNKISEDDDKNKSECIVAKNRHGEIRSVPLHWQGEYMRFTATFYNN